MRAIGMGSIKMFSGLFTSLPTPYDGDRIDEQALADLCAWHLDEGVDGVLVGHVTGEPAALTEEGRDRLVRIAVQACGRRGIVLAATGTNCTSETLERTLKAQVAGAAGAVVTVPYYNKPSQEGLFRHFAAVAAKADIPVLVADDPAATRIGLRPATLARLARVPGIAGIVDASGDIGRPYETEAITGEGFVQLCGSDQANAMFLLADGNGLVSVIGNLVPSLLVQMRDAARAQNWRQVSAIHERLRPLCAALAMETEAATVKHALSLLRPGFNPSLRLPLVEPEAVTRQAIAAALADLHLAEGGHHPGLMQDSSQAHPMFWQ